jgi:predicted nuclease of predicted toxin-antitoxin system
MTLRLLIDMNLSVEWVTALALHDISAVHWSTVGDPRATDSTLLAWAGKHQHVLFTHDLDFGTLLARTHASGPSVLQIRARNVLPRDLVLIVVATLGQYRHELARGALLVVDPLKSRVRLLPL